MNNKRILVLYIIIILVLVAGYLIYKYFFLTPTPKYAQEYEWTVIDEYYTPKDLVEDFIKQDALARNNLPVNIINYGENPSVLRRFRGKRFAGPTEAQLSMMFSGLEEWKLVDIMYKTEKDQEVQRAVLYVYLNGEWTVGDSGQLAKR
jgi:Flp pilus assembly protein CpaB